MWKLIKALFKGNYTYVTTGPCGKCGEVSEMALDDEAYLLYLESGNDKQYDHLVCPQDVVFVE